MRTQAFLIRIAISTAISLSIPLQDLENQIYSLRFKIMQRTLSFLDYAPQQNSSVIINFDADDYFFLNSKFQNEKYDSKGEPYQDFHSIDGPSKATRTERLRDHYYWSPTLYREVLKTVLAQQPKHVAFTWFINRDVIESLPDLGLELLARNPKVFWSSQFDSDDRYQSAPSILTDSQHYGYNNIFPDSDGVVRRAHFSRAKQKSLIQAIANQSTENFQTPKSDFLIQYSGLPGTIPTCKATPTFLKTYPAESPCNFKNFTNKTILLSRDTEKTDNTVWFRTPVGELSRAEILASELHTLNSKKFIYETPFAIWATLLLASVTIGATFIIYYPVMVSAIALIAGGFFTLGIVFQIFFQIFHIFIPASNIAFASLITYLVFTGYRLAFQENLQWRALKQSQYLKELEQMKSNFLSLVSHDLKTPIAKIQAAHEHLYKLIEATDNHSVFEKQKFKEIILSIQNSNVDLKNYVTSILNLSRIESQKVILNKKSNDINLIIQSVLNRLSSFAQSRNIKFETDLEPLFSVEFDEELIRQVLTNLVDNALKYSPEHSKVILRSKEIEGYIQVEVEDFGPGIPPDQLPFMFRKFSRHLRPITAQVKGSGLGLYLSRYFIELHGGKIELRTEENKGTTFTFILPLSGGEDESLLS